MRATKRSVPGMVWGGAALLVPVLAIACTVAESGRGSGPAGATPPAASTGTPSPAPTPSPSTSPSPDVTRRSTKAITSFRFLAAVNPSLSSDVVATIQGLAIEGTVPHGTDVTTLRATFETDGASVSVGATPQDSGVTPNDFTRPLEYAVTAEDGTSQRYTVRVSIAAPPDAGGDAGGDAPGGLFIGHYREDPTTNPEDPTSGALYLNLPET